MKPNQILSLVLTLVVVGLLIYILYIKPEPTRPEVIPVYIDRTDTVRIEQIRTYINNYTREPERIIIYQADTVQLDSILNDQLDEIAKRGW